MGKHIIRDAVLGYEIVISGVALCELPDATLIAQPRIAGMLPKHADHACALDIIALRQSLAGSEADYPITCSCGVPDDTGIHAPIRISRDNGTICWHFDMHKHGVLFEDSLSLDTRITLRFDLTRYAATVSSLLVDIRRWLVSPITTGDLRQLPDLRGHLPVEDDILMETFFEPGQWYSEGRIPELD